MLGTPRVVIAAVIGALCAPGALLLPQSIRLGDVVAGGDGSGNAPAANTGIDPRTGRFTTGYLEGPLSLGDAVDDGVNPSPVSDSPYVDSVFLIAPALPGSGTVSQAITASGIRFDFPAVDGTGSAWNYILRDRNGGVSTPGIRVGGAAIPTGSAVGIHASMGVTFDLDALRARHGAERVGCFSAFWGIDDCGGGDVNHYAILSGDAGVLAGGSRSFRALGAAGAWVQMEIPATARYLTLAAGTNNGGLCGHGTFGDARITCSPCPLPGFTDLEAVEPREIPAGVGIEVTLVGKELRPEYTYLLGGLPVTGVEAADAARTRVRGICPPLPPGLHDARVESPAGGGALACLAGAVESMAEGVPAVHLVEPREVRRDGSTPVVIHGENFGTATGIRLGNRSLEDLQLESPWRITGMAPALGPAEPDGPRDVSADDPAGTAVLPEGVVYFTPMPLAVHEVTPFLVSTEGGTPVEIAGDGFLPGMTASVGGIPLLDPAIGGPSVIGGRLPPLPAGFHAVEVMEAAGGARARLERAVEAAPPLHLERVEPRDLERDGSTPVSIHGSGFRPETRVRLGSHDLAGKTVVSSSLITGFAPALLEAEPDGPRLASVQDSRGTAVLPDAVAYLQPVVLGAFYRGDANSDTLLDLSDAIFTLNYLFQGGTAPPCMDSSDTNDDGKVDISDPVRLLSYLFLGDPPPPGLDVDRPTLDPTPDPLPCNRAQPLPRPKGVWGFADLHTHPASHLGFGADSNGNGGVFHGKPGGDLATSLATLATDLAVCASDKHSGFDADPVRHATRQAVMVQLNALTQHPHGASGNPGFGAWPHARSVLHQQMHIRSIKRAHDAGLRLLFASVTDNQLMAALWNNGFNVFGNNPTPSAQFDFNKAADQLGFIIDQVGLNASWMQIVETPAQARAAIAQGKLAVVLSVEMDKLSVDDVLYLAQHFRVRHVIPVHLVNNAFGGAAVYSDVFNVSNRFQNGEYLRVEGAQAIHFRLGWPQKLTSKSLFDIPILPSLGAVQPVLVDRNEFCQLDYEPCQEAPSASAVTLDLGHRNVRGLNASELQKLMKAGLMLDMAHMSEKCMDEAMALAESFDYPLMNSHTDFRNPQPPSVIAGPRPKKRVSSERDMTFDQVKRMAALGGVVGIGTEGRLEPSSVARFEFHPDAVLDPTSPSLALPLSPQGAGLLPGDSITSLAVEVTTGDQPMCFSGLNRAYALIDLKSGSIELPLNGSTDWAARTVALVSLPLPAGTLYQDLVAFGIRVEPRSCLSPAWKLNRLIVKAVGASAESVAMFREGTPFRSFTNAHLIWKEPFGSPSPSPGIPVKRVHFALETGGDDLRGDNDNVYVNVRRRDTVSRRVMANGRQGWAGGSLHHVSLDMPPGTVIGDLDEIFLETTFGGGVGGDNWNLESITIDTEDGNGARTRLFRADGKPWFRFTGEEKRKVAWKAGPEVSNPADLTEFLRITVVSGNDGLDPSNTATAVVTLANLQTRQVDFNLGGSLEPFSVYRRILLLPPGTRRADLLRLTLVVNASIGDAWRIGLVTVDAILDPVKTFIEDYEEAQKLMGGIPPALGTDINGFAPQMPFSAASFDYPLHAPQTHAPQELKNQVPLIPRSTFGSKVYDFRDDGLAHYGMLAELIEAADTMPGGPAVLDNLYSSAEYVIRLWEASLAAAPKVP